MSIVQNSLIEQNIRAKLLQWYQQSHRSLPWRVSKNPWHIWVSEIMLQQTRVASVLSYFSRFIERYPTPMDLALSNEEELNTYWAGLGYYARARNLLAASREVVERYEGKIPQNPEAFAQLKGVGPYTKGAVMSIAFDLEEAIVDGNVMRVFSRLFYIKSDISLPATQQKLWEIAKGMVKGESPGDFNQALMELGAVICTPKNPSCLLCPVREQCISNQKQEAHLLPIKAAKAKIPSFEYHALIIKDENQRVLLGLREGKGLLGGLWCLPMYAVVNKVNKDKQEQTEVISNQEILQQWICAKIEKILSHKKQIAEVSHAFTHKKWILKLYECSLDELDIKNELIGEQNQRQRWEFFEENQLSDLPISGPSLKALLAAQWKIKLRRGAGKQG